MFEYINFLKPRETKVAVQYNLLVRLMRLAKDKNVVKSILERTRHIPKLERNDKEELDQRLEYVTNWINDTIPEEKIIYSLSGEQRKVIKKLAYELESRQWSEEELHARLFAIPKEESLETGKFFEAAYVLLLNSTRGPRLAQFICAIGCSKAADIMKSRLNEF